MKKNILYKGVIACVVLIFLSFQAGAQSVTNYTFAGTNGTFTALTSPNATTWTGSTDDGVSALIPIGFDFWYMGVRYTNVSASTNGWVAMGSVPTDFVYTNSLSTGGSPRPVIAPLWDDLDIVSTANVTYKTSGTAGSRIFTLQYLNVKWNYLALGAVCSFQVNFYESSGKVEYVYRSDALAALSPTASIGLTATTTGSGNYLSVNNPGTSVSSTAEASVTTKRITGRTYTFTPPIPIAPGSLSFTAIGNLTMTLNWTDLSSNERGFVIYRSTDGTNYSFVTQVAAGATSSVQSGLTTGTTYYWRVYAITEGGLSTALSGTQATSCNGPVISQFPSGLTSYYKFEGNANDAAGSNSGTFQGGTPVQTTDRYGITNKAYTLNGTTNYISTTTAYTNPNTFSISIWFKTNTSIGGVLGGFSSLQTGTGGNRDRVIYMTGTGVLYFGLAPGSVKKYVNTTAAYNDGNWHMATATLGAGGMRLYVDGSLAANDPTVTTGESYTGYWRIGHDDISTWPSEPSSDFFQGTLDDAVLYQRELSASEIGVLYNSADGAGSNAPVCAGSSLNLTATTVSGATYAWTGPNGFTSALQNPVITYSAAFAGTYTVQVTIPGCAVPSVAYVRVLSTGTSGQWTGNISTDWANAANWCDGVLPTSTTDVVITSGATRMPNISTSVSSRSLTINSGATLTLTGTGTLNVAGTLTNNGTFTNTGTVNFNGTGGQQTFAGISSFFNLTASNSTGLLLPAATTVSNNLTIAAGILNANNFNLTVTGNWINNVNSTAFTGGTGTVTFNGSTAQSIAGTASTTFNNLTILNTGSTVTLGINQIISGNLSVSTGTLDLDAFTANRATAGGILTVANNAILKVGGTNTYPTNYSTNTLVLASTVEYSGTSQTVSNQSYGNLRLSSSSGAAVKTFPATAMTVLGNLISVQGAGTSVTYTAAAAVTVTGNVSIGAGTTFNGASFSHNVGGNWANAGTFNGNTGTVVFTGAGTTVSGAGTQNFNNLTIAASMVAFSAEGLSLTGNLATTGAGSFTQASGGTLTMSGTGTTISGTDISPDNLNITGTVTTASSIILTGNLSISGTFTASAGTITMSGTTKSISGAGGKNLYMLSVTGTVSTAVSFSIASGLTVYGSLTGTAGTATFTGTSTLSGTANLFNTTINGTSLQLSANAVLGVAGALTLTAGTLNVSSTPNTVNFNGSGAQSINALTYSNLTFSTGGTKTAAGGVTVNNDITIGTGTTFVSGNFTHSVYNNWNNNGTFTAGTGTVQFLGVQNSNISGATTFNILTVNNSAATVAVTLLSNVSVATVNMTLGTLLTGTNTLTITTTRTGNGIILGTITRNHAFAALTAYAFEGPNNLITFTLPVAINSVTVSVATGPISDFPFGGSISRVYNITVPSGTYVGATLRLHYEDAELNGNAEATMALWRYNGSSWNSSGKTGNDATANYVEQALLLDISNRWTLSASANVVQWNGSVSSDWNTVANWTVTQGSASRPPAATDVVNLGTVTFTNQPVINTAVTVRNINFGSVKAVALSLVSGGSLSSTAVKGTWSANATHSIDAGNQTVSIGGDLALSDGTSGHAINLSMGTGSVTISGSLTESGGANITFNGAGNLSIGGDFNYSSGTFTAGTGTVTYSGAANQVLGVVNYNHLTINKSAANIAVGSALSVNGNLTVTAGELDNNAVMTIAGNVSIAASATLQNNSTLMVGGNWTNAGTYNSSASGTSVVFNGTGTQSISASTFNNLEINKPVGSLAVLTGDVTLKGNLTGTSGTLDIKSFFFNRDVAGGTATIANAGTLIIGADNAPNKFANYVLGTSSTVIFNGLSTQHLLLPGLVYGNITFSNAGLKSLLTPISIKGTLQIDNGATLDGGSNTISLNGNWLNNGTFTPSTSTVLFTGTTKNITGNTTFNKATVPGSYTILNDVTFNGLLNITSTGSLSGGSTINTTMNSDLINSGTLFTLGTTTFTGNVVQTVNLINAVQTVAMTVNFNGTVSPVLNSTSTPQFGILNINNTGGVFPSVDWTVQLGFTVGTGALFGGGSSTHNFQGSVTNNGTISSSGTLNFIPPATATLNLGTNFSSTGTVVFGGAGAVTMAGTPGSMKDVLISNTNAAGISPSSNWTLTNNLSIGTGAILNAGTRTYLIAGNIINNGTINAGTSIFSLNGSAVQDIYSPSAFYKLTLNNSGGTVSISSNVTVNDALTFTLGKIQTGSFVVIQPASGSVSGAAQLTGWVNGNFRKNIATGNTSRVFEIGNASSYLPVSLSFTGVSVAGDLTVSTITGDHPSIGNSRINASKSVNRYWTMSNSGIAFTTVNVTLNYLAADVDAGANTNAFVLGGYAGGAWVYPMVGSVTSTSLTASGLTAFGDFQIGELTISIKTWDGGAGTANWGDAANWNTDGVPVATDNVQLTGPYTININVAAVTKDLILSDPGLLLTTNAGNSLSVSGNMTLAAGTFNTAASFPTVTGLIDLSGGTVGFTGSSSQTIPAYNYYNLSSSGTGARVLASTGTIGISNTFSPGTNAYTVTGSTVNYNGSGAQNVAASVYNQLTLSTGGLKSFSSGVTGIAGAITISPPATADAVANAGTISYNGTSAQTVLSMNYYNLDGANAAGLTLLDANLSNNLTVSSGTMSMGNSATVQKITVNGNLSVASGATFGVSASSDATHLLTIGGNVVNSGTFNLRQDANSLCNVIFSKNGNQTISGAGAVTSFNNITTNMGSVNTNSLEVTAAGFSAPNGFLTLNNGSFNLNNSGLTISPFLADITDVPYLVPASSGLWVNAGTINSANMNWTIAGQVKVTGGTMNIGTTAGNNALALDQARITVNGGNLNIAAAIGNPAAAWQYEMQGGQTTLNTAGSTTAGLAPFQMDAAGAAFSMSAGTLVIQNSGGTAGQNLGYTNLSTGGTGFTGGTLQMGNGSTAAATTMNINALNPIYNLTVGSSNTTVPLQSALTVSNNVTVTAGTLDINTRTLKIGGNISNSGSFIVSNGMIEMNGSALQSIPAAAFTGNLIKNLKINNAAGVNLGGPLSLSDILLVSNGQFASAGNLTLLSSATQTALIDGSGTGTVSGNVTMQRYLIAGFGYKYFSPPVQNATVNSFASTVDLNATFPNFYNYIEDKVSSGFTSYTNPSSPLVPLQGYAADFGSSMAPKTVSISGPVNNGTMSATLYNHNQLYTKGFNLVGNPYPSPINWDAASGLTKTNIDNAVYFFNSGTVSQYTGAYSTYINGVSSDGIAGPVIASMQGFFVHVSDGSYPVTGTLAMNNNVRVNDLSPVFHKSMAARMDAQNSVPRMLLRLSAGFADHSNSSDPLVLYSNQGAGRNFDKARDAIKLMNIDELLPNVYSIGADASKLVVKALEGVDTSTVIPLGIETHRDGNVVFNLRNLENWPAGLNLYLRDAVTGTNQNLQQNPVYTVSLKKGVLENRFSLRTMAAKDVIDGSGDVYTVFGSNGGLFLRIKLMDEQSGYLLISNVLGQVISRKKIEGNGVYPLEQLTPNIVYLVSFITTKKTHTTKVQITGK
ncbi:hypothetical protein DBR43_27705 [Pedobacter sp. KBW06]|uniref:fibronectin type III domain-containing protein n=1 Tax=Pedobacter sp. KBW06 TaxID=2153359 RepID=UPI000F597F17|nr:fibronectin type III domain-containing protein [Pedobacter sp. KBW06]RQO66030.1 hypothetical protein DBR43_27705 [Pedobacter sp. KBW06]